MQSHEHKHINQDRFADSAGVPWDGREFQENKFADDDGSARPELLEAIKNFHETGDPKKVFEEFTKSRLLIPLLADLGESGKGAHGQTIDKSADLSIVTVQTPDEQTALPVFSSVQTMLRWNSKARPVPSDAIRVALAAASEGTTRVVLDPGSDSEFALRRAAIAAIAQQKNWTAPHLDLAVQDDFAESVKNEAAISAIHVASGDPMSRLAGAEIKVTLELMPGLASDELQEILNRITQKWSQSKSIATGVDSMSLVVKPTA